jgi:hypothetical protein
MPWVNVLTGSFRGICTAKRTAAGDPPRALASHTSHGMLFTYHNPKETTMIRTVALAFSLAAVALSGCQSTPARVRASEGRDAQMLGRIAALEGEWEMVNDDGTTEDGSVFEVSGAGSNVREIMFPGHGHEMTNMYHMDGDKLVVTHYCASGNQPRMVASEARESDDGIVYEFDFDSVSNLRPDHEHYMGQMTLTILNDGTIREDWRSFDAEGKLTDPMVFHLRRKAGA